MLSAYQLALGYQESADLDGGRISVRLWREYGTYHVRAHNHATDQRLLWLSFQTLKEARAEYRRTVAQVRQGKLY